MFPLTLNSCAILLLFHSFTYRVPIYDQLNWSNYNYRINYWALTFFFRFVRSVWSFNSVCSKKKYTDEIKVWLRMFTRLAFIKLHKSFILLGWPIDWSSINFPLLWFKKRLHNFWLLFIFFSNLAFWFVFCV